ncbi:MAG: hypothetical protein KF715_08550 [Candidatus Didemnitutus sp.]|nr:hypothetical protein [Candidatus Didemnitutus sp.]
MKTKLPIIAALVCAFAFALVFFAPSAVAQTSSDSSGSVASALVQPDTAAAIAAPFIVTFAAKYPWVLTLLAVMGGLRFFFKPVVSLVEAYVRSTPQKTDDEYFDKVEHSAAFKIIAWALDFFASVKVGPQFTAQPKKTESTT